MAGARAAQRCDRHSHHSTRFPHRCRRLGHRCGSGERGFDITGHRYWFNHPWASSDVVLSIRTDLGPAERGLVGVPPGHAAGGQPDREPIVWSIPADYPDRLRGLADRRGQSALREWTPEDEGR